MKLLQLGVALALLGTVVGTCPHQEPGLEDWSQGTTWSSGTVPVADDQVVIPTGKHVLLDSTTPCLASLVIEENASLVWGDRDDTTLCTGSILVQGRLQAGSEDCRLNRKATIRLTGESDSPHNHDVFGRKFIGVVEGGTLEIHGEEKPTWTKLVQTVEAAHSTCGSIFNYQDTALSQESHRGLYVGVFNSDGSLFDFGVFRTGENKSGDADLFKEFLEDIPNNKIVSVALQGDIGYLDNNPVYAAIESLGGLTSSIVRNVIGRQAYAFITKKGDTSKTKERHVFNPYSNDFVETGYLSLTENQRRFRVNSRVYSDSSEMKGVDFQVLTEEVANPCIYVDADVSTWREGDVVVVGSTDFDWRQAEEMTITSSSGNQLCFSEPFEYLHYGEVSQGVDVRGEVGLLSRRFVIEGEKQATCTPKDDVDEKLCQRFGEDTFGGHVKVLRNATSVQVQGVELRHMGQQRNLGTYPLHFHMCDDVDGFRFSYNSIHDTTRCVTIHGTDGAEFSYNFCYKNRGHSVFLEDCVEQRNIIKGNLVIGTMHGQHLLSDMKTEWCDEELKPFCDALSSFWLTHPNNRVTDNVAGGSDNVGFWYVTSSVPLMESYKRQLVRKKVGNFTAIHTKILEFRNNTAHSNRMDGLRMDHRISHGEEKGGVQIPPNGVIGGQHSHTPRVDPWDLMSDFTESYMYSFTAHKNGHRNMWIKAGIVIIVNTSLADAPRSITIARATEGTYAELRQSRLIGETDNTGMPEEPFGRSSPNWDSFEVLQGIQFYQGPGIYTDCFFDKYEVKTSGSETRRAGAISVKRNNPYPPKANSRVKGMKFGFCDGVEGNWAFDGNPVKPFLNKDGNRQITFRDEDGSVSGTANTQFVPNSRFHTTPRCDYRANMNFAVCPYKYAKVVFSGDGALTTLDKQYPMHMRRDDRPNDPFYLKGEKGNNYLTIIGKSYTAYFNGTAPSKLTIQGINMERGDTVRLGLCYPKDVTSFTFSGGFPGIDKTSNPAISVNSIGALDEDTTGKAYFHDKATGLLFIKLISFSDRVNHEMCPGYDCGQLVIKRFGGSDGEVDCSAEAYDGTYNKPEDSASPEDIPTAKTCSKLADSSAYGAPVETPFFSPTPVSLTCPADSAASGRVASEYKGCFKDESGSPDLPEAYNKLVMGMTIDFCVDRCYERGYMYAGLRNGKMCVCGELYGRYGTSTECDVDCSGDKTRKCGGQDTNSVYSTGQPRCGHNNYGRSINSGECYAVFSDVSIKYVDAEHLCATRRGVIADASDTDAYEEIKKHLSLFTEDKAYWVKENNDVYTELDSNGMFAKEVTSSTDKNGVVCKIETVPTGECSTGWEKHGDSCYFTNGRGATYDNYKTLCNQGDSSVLTINSETENTYIAEDLCKDKSLVYLGYVYNTASSKFEWEQGTSSQELWLNNQGVSNIADGNCAALKVSKGAWKNRPCSKSATVVCEAPVAG